MIRQEVRQHMTTPTNTTPTVQITATEATCTRCGYTWRWKDADQRPAKCSKCNSHTG